MLVAWLITGRVTKACIFTVSVITKSKTRMYMLPRTCIRARTRLLTLTCTHALHLYITLALVRACTHIRIQTHQKYINTLLLLTHLHTHTHTHTHTHSNSFTDKSPLKHTICSRPCTHWHTHLSETHIT